MHRGFILNPTADSVVSRLSPAEIAMGPADRETLRRLAGDVRDLAERAIEAEKRTLWLRHNALDPSPPLIFCDPENGWHEIIPPDALRCTGTLARLWEMHLRKEIFWGREMRDDYVIVPVFRVPHIHQGVDWGLTAVRVGGDGGGAYRWESPVKSDDDLGRLRFPDVRVDRQATERLAALASDVFGDLLTVQIRSEWWWSLGLTSTLAELRGMEQVMWDVVDRPDLVHRLMGFLRDGTLAMLDSMEREGLLGLNNDGTYVGSGGFGWTAELPQPDFDGCVRTRDMWGFAESQETIGISPQMFAEFVFPYQMAVLERFGLNCYGCCEPLERRWPVVKQLPRLRRVSVSPWADVAKMAEYLDDDYIFSLKPNPTPLAMADFDEDQIRAELRRAFLLARGCRLEVIMKDNHTIRGDPRRVVRWVQICREEAERF